MTSLVVSLSDRSEGRKRVARPAHVMGTTGVRTAPHDPSAAQIHGLITLPPRGSVYELPLATRGVVAHAGRLSAADVANADTQPTSLVVCHAGATPMSSHCCSDFVA